MEIISEIGINHNGDFRRIEEMIRQSASAGADYAKFQLYSSKRVFGDDSRKQNEFTFDEVTRIKSVCDFYNIEFFASVFDEDSISNAYKQSEMTVATLLNNIQNAVETNIIFPNMKQIAAAFALAGASRKALYT